MLALLGFGPSSPTMRLGPTFRHGGTWIEYEVSTASLHAYPSYLGLDLSVSALRSKPYYTKCPA